MTGTPPRVGFVGLGNMGSPMAQNLRDAGFPLTVFDVRTQTATDFAADSDVQVAADLPALFAESDIVIAMLPNGAIVRSVISAGLDGMPKTAERHGRLIVDMSSSAPQETRSLHELVSAHGYGLVDAPVSGGVARAKTGELSILVGGAEDDAALAAPLFEVLGANVFHVGGVGAGHAMKAINNLMSAGGLLLTAEAMIMGAKSGLDPEVMLGVLNASTGRTHATETKIIPYVLSGTYLSGFALQLMVKDLGIAQGIAQETGSPFVLGSAAKSVWELAKAQLPADADQMELVRWLESLAGIDLAATDAP